MLSVYFGTKPTEFEKGKAGIARASSHSGRRTLITRLVERGVAQIAGHTSIRTTAMYVESNPTRLARILQDVTFRGLAGR